MTDQAVSISQHDLQELFELAQEVDQKQKRLEDLRAYMKALLVAKTPIEMGRFDAHLIFKTIHHPAWKQTVIKELGAEFAEAVRRASPTSVLCDVMVEEHAIPPLWKASMGVADTKH
jgi:hypothetical protein